MVETPAHLVVVESVYHQRHGAQPTGMPHRFSRRLRTDQQPFSREIVVGESWTAIENCWLSGASQLVIENVGTRFHLNPTEEQRDAAAAKIVEVCVLVPAEVEDDRDMFSPPRGRDRHSAPWLVPPGESMRAQPSDLSLVRIRCRSGSVKVVVHLIPE